MAVLQQMLIFFILIAIGIYARKKSIITKENQAQFSALVVNVTYPALILSSAMSSGERVSGSDLLTAVGVAIVLIALTMVMGAIVPRILRYPKDQRSIMNLMIVFTNIGFMGVPMIRGLYGDSALIYMTIFLIPFNLLFYAYAIPTIQGKLSKGGGFSPRDLLNAGMIACVLAIVIYLADIQLPYVITNAVLMLGDVTAPLAMMLLGSFLLDVNWKSVLTDARMIVYCLVKMLAVPIILVGTMSTFITNPLLLAVCMAAISTPSGNVLALLTDMYAPQLSENAVGGIALTTLISVITMPICFMAVGL